MCKLGGNSEGIKLILPYGILALIMCMCFVKCNLRLTLIIHFVHQLSVRAYNFLEALAFPPSLNSTSPDICRNFEKWLVLNIWFLDLKGLPIQLQESSQSAEEAVPSTSGTQPASNQEPADDMYNLLDMMCPTSTMCSDTELDRWLKDPCTTEEPLTFWKKNAGSYPLLAKLAALCFGIPATSGSVERLFSIAGSLQRARRSSLNADTIEQLVLVGESVRLSKAS